MKRGGYLPTIDPKHVTLNPSCRRQRRSLLHISGNTSSSQKHITLANRLFSVAYTISLAFTTPLLLINHLTPWYLSDNLGITVIVSFSL